MSNFKFCKIESNVDRAKKLERQVEHEFRIGIRSDSKAFKNLDIPDGSHLRVVEKNEGERIQDAYILAEKTGSDGSKKKIYYAISQKHIPENSHYIYVKPKNLKQALIRLNFERARYPLTKARIHFESGEYEKTRACLKLAAQNIDPLKKINPTDKHTSNASNSTKIDDPKYLAASAATYLQPTIRLYEKARDSINAMLAVVEVEIEFQRLELHFLDKG